MSDEITESELFRAIQEAQLAHPEIESGTLITSEYAAHIGVSNGSALKRIKAAIKAGEIVPAVDIMRPNLHGIWMRMRGYRLATKKPGG